jgi:hypothetical protein
MEISFDKWLITQYRLSVLFLENVVRFIRCCVAVITENQFPFTRSAHFIFLQVIWRWAASVVRGNVPTSWLERRGFKPGGGRRIFKDEKIQGTSPPGGTLSCLTRVVKNLKPQGGLWAKLSAISRPKVSVEALRRADHSFKDSCRLWIE